MFALFFSLVSSPVFAATDLPYKLSAEPSLKEVQVFEGHGQKHLAYEIYLQNFEKKALILQSLEIEERWSSGKTSKRKFSREELVKMYSGIAEDPRKAQNPILQAGQAGVLYVFLSFPEGRGAPQEITSNVIVNAQAELPKTIQTKSLIVSSTAAAKIIAPLKGKNWFTPNGPSNASTHRRVVLPIDGQVYIPERFAVDWVQVDENGKTFAGDATRNESYYAYREAINAVAAGKVLVVKDGIPENTPTAKEMAVVISMDSIGGNYVIQEIAPNTYAFYAHLIPGSLKVKAGDVLKAGDSIALVGNSGNSSEPHLHFQIIDQPNPLRGEGIPFELKNFTRTDYDMKLDEKEDFTYFKMKGQHAVVNESFMDYDLGDF